MVKRMHINIMLITDKTACVHCSLHNLTDKNCLLPSITYCSCEQKLISRWKYCDYVFQCEKMLKGMQYKRIFQGRNFIEEIMQCMTKKSRNKVFSQESILYRFLPANIKFSKTGYKYITFENVTLFQYGQKKKYFSSVGQ